MITPHKISLGEYMQRLNKWWAEHMPEMAKLTKFHEGDPTSELGLKIPFGNFHCKRCQTGLKTQVAYVSVHDSQFDICIAIGRVLHFYIPYCPKCERVPEDRGCIHLLTFPIDNPLETVQ